MLTGKTEQFRLVEIKLGTVDMEACTMVSLEEPPVETQIRRAEDNTKRKRPNARGRHDPYSTHYRGASTSSISSSHNTELEWLSLNYRKVKAAMLSSS